MESNSLAQDSSSRRCQRELSINHNQCPHSSEPLDMENRHSPQKENSPQRESILQHSSSTSKSSSSNNLCKTSSTPNSSFTNTSQNGPTPHNIKESSHTTQVLATDSSFTQVPATDSYLTPVPAIDSYLSTPPSDISDTDSLSVKSLWAEVYRKKEDMSGKGAKSSATKSSLSDTKRGTDEHGDKLYALGIDIDTDVTLPRKWPAIPDELEPHRKELLKNLDSTVSGGKLKRWCDRFTRFDKGGFNEKTRQAFCQKVLFVEPDSEKRKAGDLFTPVHILECRSKFLKSSQDKGNSYVYTRDFKPNNRRSSRPQVDRPQVDIMKDLRVPAESDLAGVTDLVIAFDTDAFDDDLKEDDDDTGDSDLGEDRRIILKDYPGVLQRGYVFAPLVFLEFKANNDTPSVKEAMHQAATQAYVTCVEKQRLNSLAYRGEEQPPTHVICWTICGNDAALYYMYTTPSVQNDETITLYKFYKTGQFDMTRSQDLQKMMKKCVDVEVLTEYWAREWKESLSRAMKARRTRDETPDMDDTVAATTPKKRAKFTQQL